MPQRREHHRHRFRNAGNDLCMSTADVSSGRCVSEDTRYKWSLLR
ncbi:hypothetical protein AB0I84_38475 [Streptomyces spectabilis]